MKLLAAGVRPTSSGREGSSWAWATTFSARSCARSSRLLKGESERELSQQLRLRQGLPKQEAPRNASWQDLGTEGKAKLHSCDSMSSERLMVSVNDSMPRLTNTLVTAIQKNLESWHLKAVWPPHPTQGVVDSNHVSTIGIPVD